MAPQHIHNQSHSAARKFESGIELIDTLETDSPSTSCKPLMQLFARHGFGREKANANRTMGEGPAVHHFVFFAVVDLVVGDRVGVGNAGSGGDKVKPFQLPAVGVGVATLPW